MKLAWFTPFSRKSAIGKFSSIVVAETSRHHDVTIYASDLTGSDDAWVPSLAIRYLPQLRQTEILSSLEDFDIVIYNLGDNLQFHRLIYDVSTRHPGIVILHDLVMHHFFAGYYLQHKQNDEGYLRHLEFSHGHDGRALGSRILADTVGDVWKSQEMLDYHMAKSAIIGCLGIVVHSEFAANALRQCSTLPTWKIDFPAPFSPGPVTFSAQATGEPNAKVRLLTFGLINANKLVHDVVSTIAKSPVLRRRVVYDVIGGIEVRSYATELDRLVRQHALQDVVRFHGYQPDEVLNQFISAADIVVNLRRPHFGESSWVLLESLFSGKPSVVWAHGHYDEFPDDVVVKVRNLGSLADRLIDLVENEDWRRTLGTKCRDYARARFSTPAYVEHLDEVIHAVQSERAVTNLTDFTSTTLDELGIHLDGDYLVDKIAREVAAWETKTPGSTEALVAAASETYGQSQSPGEGS